MKILLKRGKKMENQKDEYEQSFILGQPKGETV